MDAPKLLENLLVVIVLFKQKPEQSTAYHSLHDALGNFYSFPEIFIYDNSPASSRAEPHITYIHDPANSGVSKAYNQASMVARRKNKKWMMLLDQDTRVEAEVFEKWSGALTTHPEAVAFVPVIKDRKGIISPFRFSRGRGKRTSVFQKKFSLEKYRFINSGLFIRNDAFVQAGGYDEDIPLDFSDISFGERLRAVTDHFVMIDVSLLHALSGSEKLPLSEALGRFHYFCKGASAMGKKTGRAQLFSLRAFFRASHLCVRYRNSSFLKIFNQSFLHG
jgi:GT2 family glycosyltransferase